MTFPTMEDGVALTAKAWDFLETRAAGLKLPPLQIDPLGKFLEDNTQSTLAQSDCEAILDQAELLFKTLYAHLPFKEQNFRDARPAANPLGQLALIRKAVRA